MSTKKQIPEEFKKIIFEFLGDISNTFPEYKRTLSLFLDSNGVNLTTSETETSETQKQKVVDILYEYCSKVYPERFFDILYKNEKLFNKTEYNVNTHFLPNIDFSVLWNTEGISDATREIIWKYLQLILMTIITNIDDRKSFGDAANLFEAINEDELRSKLEETIQQMYNMFEHTNVTPPTPNASPNLDPNADPNLDPNADPMFDFFDWTKNMGNNTTNANNANGNANENEETEPNANAESIHDHISQILNGKIGKLAKEIAEETAKDVDFDMNDFTDGTANGENVDFKNVFQKMFKNPGKLMSLVKNVGSKLDQKFKSGEIKESELMQEASELLSKMKNMPGMGNLTDMLNKMGMGGMMGGMGGGNSKVNVGAMQSNLQRNMKMSKMKERMQQKLQEQRAAAQAAAASAQAQSQSQAQAQAQAIPVKKQSQVFSTGEVVERTPVTSVPSATTSAVPNKKKNKKK
jgi:hypothetical protein